MVKGYDLPGSLEVVSVTNGDKWEIRGKSIDSDKLPKKASGVGAGSSCFMVDNGSIWMYLEKSDEWTQV